jgi:hypothetical protein
MQWEVDFRQADPAIILSSTRRPAMRGQRRRGVPEAGKS